MDQVRLIGIPLDQDLVELFLADLVGRRLAQRILTDLAQPLAPIIEDLLEGTLFAWSPRKPSVSLSSAL